jgi:hypothetical protein
VQSHCRGSAGTAAGAQATGNLPWAAIDDLVAALAVDVGAVVVDLGCGRGGYGVEVARRTETSLAGVDFSTVAPAQAAAVTPPVTHSPPRPERHDVDAEHGARRCTSAAGVQAPSRVREPGV